MPDKQDSAEKDLLRLIENPGEVELRKAKVPVPGEGGKGLPKKISMFSFAKRSPKQSVRSPFSFQVFLTDRKQILRLLFVVMILFFAYFIAVVAIEFRKMKNTKNLVKFTYISAGKEARVNSEAVAGANTDPEIQLETANIRNIFKPGAAKKEDDKRDEGTVALTDYRLVGISLSADPNEIYAMIKNVKTNITFFLKKGEKLDGMELLSIFDNKLVLKVKDKEVELR